MRTLIVILFALMAIPLASEAEAYTGISGLPSEPEEVEAATSAMLDAELTLTKTESAASLAPEQLPREYCEYAVPEKEIHNAEFIVARKKLRVMHNEEFRVKVFIRNTGTVPWFSKESQCEGPKISLGTDAPRDHHSSFYHAASWEGHNRIGMDQKRVEPGDIASFTFMAKAHSISDVIKQFYTPVIEGVAWLENAKFGIETIVGTPYDTLPNTMKRLSYGILSGSVADIDLHGEKTLRVDLSEQNLYVELGGRVIRIFRISSGAARTPTPVGTTQIQLKQEVRIGSKAPHYIMPRFMWFRAGGYGFHALPSLRYDNGYFWTEARNHIGTPVSHGCVRLLPEDADFAFEFAEIGTKVIVQR